MYSEFAACSYKNRPFRAKNGAFSVKIPRHLEKTPPKPKILGLGGVFRGCLAVEKMCGKRVKKHSSFL